MNPIVITSGEPAGIGPDLCLALAGHPIPLVVLGNRAVLEDRARYLGLSIVFNAFRPGEAVIPMPGSLTVWSVDCESVVPGRLDVRHASYVLELLRLATDGCLSGMFSAMVTAPVHKGIINQAGIEFTGHTEWLARHCGARRVVMMMVSPKMRVALVTTHLPLRAVADAVTEPLLTEVLQIVHHALRCDFGIQDPLIRVAGLNPHAGENGYLGHEEQQIITPVLNVLREQGLNVEGPMSADTLFVQSPPSCDAYVMMYHDQGLPVIKYADFEHTVNVTLGLPMIRTSVDHGTALNLVGLGVAKPDSLLAALDCAKSLVQYRGV